MNFFEEELAELKNKNLYRKLRELKALSPVRALYEGREILLFCGNDYLGLTHHPRVVQALQQAVSETGTGSGAARLISGNSSDHANLEQKIAKYKKKERALLFSAGYLANLGVLSALAGPGDLILMDKLCHASLVDGARLAGAQVRVFPHQNYARAGEILKKASGYKKKLIVSDAVFSMDGDIADVEALVRLKEKYGALLILDEAHATGVFPDDYGKEIAPENILNQVDIVVGTLSKAAGVLGGFAAASSKTIDYLTNFSRPFIFATALPPALCRAAAAALDIMEDEPQLRKKLWENVRDLESRLGTHAESPILPLILGPEEKALAVSEKLLAQGILAPAVRYPTVPRGKARLRITVSAAHGPAEIDRLAKALSGV